MFEKKLRELSTV